MIKGNITEKTIKAKSKRRARDTRLFFIFTLPVMLGFLIFSLYPLCRSFYLSFTDRTLLGFEETKFVFFKNYIRAFNDVYVWDSLKKSGIYTFFTVIIVNATGLASAVLLNVKNRFINVYRTIYYIPCILPATSSVIMFTWIFNPSSGIINNILTFLGCEQTPLWLEGYSTVMPTLILMSFWAFGGKMVIYLAGLQGISGEYYEAAEIEGATGRERFSYITLPLLSNVIFYNILMSVIGGLQVFTEAYVLSGTGTGVSVNFYVVNLFSHAFTSPYELGYASSLAWILFTVILTASGTYFYINKKYFSYDVA